MTGEFSPGQRGKIHLALRVMSAIHELQREAQVGWAQHFIVFHLVKSSQQRRRETDPAFAQNQVVAILYAQTGEATNEVN